ncbi:hypothetical protein AB0395_34850 [Streptosporangium sp. NPDC051023]|uniref:hypothetical protein n=1 Tax=Streptosporangium sp. NPDC051023 TaxID=3155410 RepID=UPI00344FA698
MTTGQTFATTLRATLHIGPRTRRRRAGLDVVDDMLEQVTLAATLPGYHAPARQEALAPGFAAVLAWRKHVDGYRIDGTQRAYLVSVSPWRFAAILGDMIDAGVSNSGEGERYFAARADRDRAAWRERNATGQPARSKALSALLDISTK